MALLLSFDDVFGTGSVESSHGRARHRLRWRRGADRSSPRRVRTSTSSASMCTRPASPQCSKQSSVAGLRNVRVVDGDVLDFIGSHSASDRSSAIRVFFPDPWPKRRQREPTTHSARRRLPIGWSCLRAGGTLHLATDSADYARQIRTVCDADPVLRGGPIETAFVAADHAFRTTRRRRGPAARSTCSTSRRTARPAIRRAR